MWSSKKKEPDKRKGIMPGCPELLDSLMERPDLANESMKLLHEIQRPKDEKSHQQR